MLTDKQIRLVHETLPLVREKLQPASMVFYENMFAIEPSMRALFRDDLAGQGMKFLTTLDTIAEILDDPEGLDTELRALARAHSGVGVRREHFAPMGSALMVTLGETLGSQFTEEVRDAWRAAYEEIARRMQELADRE